MRKVGKRWYKHLTSTDENATEKFKLTVWDSIVAVITSLDLKFLDKVIINQVDIKKETEYN